MNVTTSPLLLAAAYAGHQDGTEARPQPITYHAKVFVGLEHIHGASLSILPSLAAPGSAGLSPL